MSDRTCSVDDCDRSRVARGFCLMHYKRYMKSADPDVVSRDGTAHVLCLQCGQPNPAGRRKYCSASCGAVAAAAQRVQWRIDNPESQHRIDERAKVKRRRTRHNLPVDLVWPTLCDICGDATELHVDHDHKCCPGKYSCGQCVCGFLCNNCNNGLGRFKDDPNRLRKAAEYIERTRGVRVTDLVDRLVSEHPDLVAAAMLRRDLM